MDYEGDAYMGIMGVDMHQLANIISKLDIFDNDRNQEKPTVPWRLEEKLEEPRDKT